MFVRVGGIGSVRVSRSGRTCSGCAVVRRARFLVRSCAGRSLRFGMSGRCCGVLFVLVVRS